MTEQCLACGSELLHPEPICQDCGAVTGDEEPEECQTPEVRYVHSSDEVASGDNIS